MQQLRKPYLLLSSFFLFSFFVSCHISKFKQPKQCNRVVITNKAFEPVLNKTKATKYKGSIDVLKNHLTGIIIVKQTDSATTHIIFVTEIGMKMFDFEWKNNEMKAAYVFEPLNKPTLIKALLSNFKQMFLLDVFDKSIGINKIKCIHVNDSMNPIGSHKDRHANLGYGTIGFDNLINVIYNKRLDNIPKILETPWINRNEKDVRGIRHQVVSIVEELNFEKQSIKVGN